MIEYGKYYMYRHIRLDTNEPFYIGVGQIASKENIDRYYMNTERGVYNRAYTKSSRSNFWKNIVSKTPYKVQVIYETFDLEEINKKEQEFIKLYGRRDLNMGTLVNLTDGGEGVKKLNPSTIELIRQLKLGVKLSESHILKLSLAKKGKPIKHLEGFKHSEKTIEQLKNTKKCKIVVQYSLNGDFIKEYKSLQEVKRQLNISAISCISRVCNNERKTAFGYIWKFKKDTK
jgi:hypothetical protein